MISASDCLDKAPHYNLLAGCIEDSIGRTRPAKTKQDGHKQG